VIRYPSTKLLNAEEWESMTVKSLSGGEFLERTDNIVGDVTLFARGGAVDKLSACGIGTRRATGTIVRVLPVWNRVRSQAGGNEVLMKALQTGAIIIQFISGA
jgi:hypothetical protein